MLEFSSDHIAKNFYKELARTTQSVFSLLRLRSMLMPFATKLTLITSSSIDSIDITALTSMVTKTTFKPSKNSIDFYVKDLSMFKNIKKDDVLMLDNFIYSYALDLENGIPIKPYYMGKKDKELKYIADKLQAIRNEPGSTSGVQFINKAFALQNFYGFLEGRDMRKSTTSGRGTMRASVVVGAPKSPPSPSPSRRNRGYTNNYTQPKTGYQRNRNNSPNPHFTNAGKTVFGSNKNYVSGYGNYGNGGYNYV